MLKIKTAAGNECFIEDEDLKFYKDAEVLAEDVDIEDAKAEEVDVEETEE